MKEFLEKCKEEYTLKIPQLLKEVKLKTHYTKWSKTVLSAYQLEPFETELLGYKLGRFGNVSDVLLKFQQLANQYNIKELSLYFPLPIIEKSILKGYNTLEIV